MIDRTTLGVGVTLGTVGPEAARLTVVHDAQVAEAAGFDTIWAFDHVLMPTELSSRYPFADSGEILWNPADPWFDTLIWLTAVAVSTRYVEIGTNILLAALRQPLVLAKQIATIDQLASGRFTLGVGAGWLQEEFEALGIGAQGRGKRLDETLDLLLSAWTGRMEPHEGEYLGLTRPVHMLPTPAHEIPILVGGASPRAFDRIARLHAGWIAETRPSQDPIAHVRTGVRRIVDTSAELGTPYTDAIRVVYNANEPLTVLDRRLDSLIEAGVTDVAISVDLANPDEAINALKLIRGLN